MAQALRPQRRPTGRMRLVRFPDDFLLTFERLEDAERMNVALAMHLAKFGFRLREDKTRLSELSRFAEANRRRRGQRLQLPWDRFNALLGAFPCHHKDRP